MAEMEIPGWFRWVEVLFGLILIILAAVLFVYVVEYYQFIIIVIALILIGILSVIRVLITKFPGWLRIIKIIINLIIIIVAIVVIVFYGAYPIGWLFWMLSVALILDGLDWILLMLVAGPEGVIKWLVLLLGLIELIIAAAVFVMIAYAWWLLAGAVILSGLNILIKGLLSK